MDGNRVSQKSREHTEEIKIARGGGRRGKEMMGSSRVGVDGEGDELPQRAFGGGCFVGGHEVFWRLRLRPRKRPRKKSRQGCCRRSGIGHTPRHFSSSVLCPGLLPWSGDALPVPPVLRTRNINRQRAAGKTRAVQADVMQTEEGRFPYLFPIKNWRQPVTQTKLRSTNFAFN